MAPTAARPLDLQPIRPLLARIEAQYHPEQIWLFGSRARGDERPGSDWDLFVVVPDDTRDDVLDLRFLWRLTRGSGVPVDVIACRASELREACDTVNTLSYVVANEGVRIDEDCVPSASRPTVCNAPAEPFDAERCVCFRPG